MSHKTHQPRLTLKRIACTALACAALAATALPEAIIIQPAKSILALLIPAANATDLYVEPTGVGIGVQVPQRSLHLRGSNATFRMDRNVDGASFFLVRTDNNWNAIKTYQIGVVASGPNNGSFIINDLGQAVGGNGLNRMTITNDGETHFTGTVRAPAFVNSSSAKFKTNIKTLHDATLLLNELRGVRFNWTESGDAALGLIAEEVAEVLPEVVAYDETGPSAVNYSALVAVLIEANKAQQAQIAEQAARIDALNESLLELRSASRDSDVIASLALRLARLEAELPARQRVVVTPAPEDQGVKNRAMSVMSIAEARP